MRCLPLKWPGLLVLLCLLAPYVGNAAAQCTTPAGATFTESFGDAGNACWPGGPTGCNQAWQVQGGTYSIVASPDGAPRDTACANSLLLAASSTAARLQTYGTIPRIPSGTTLDLYFSVYITTAPRNGFNFVQLRNVTKSSNTVLSQIVWKNSNGTFLSASGSTSSGNTEAVGLNSWHNVQLHVDAVAQNSYVVLDAGTPQTFTVNASDMNAVLIYGDTVGSYYIGNMYINAPGYAPTGAPMFVDFSGGNPGDPITTASMNASSHCANVPWTMSSTSMTDMVYSTDQTHTLHTSVQACGTTYSGNSGMSLRYDMSSSQVATYYYETLSPSVSMGFFYNTTERPNSEVFYCNADILGALDYACVHQHGNGKTLQIWLEVNINPELFGAPIPISPNTWYWVTLQYNAGGTHHLRVYETQNWTLIGASDGPSNHGVDLPVRFDFGRSGSSPGPVGTYLYFSDIELDWVTGQFPLGPGGGDIPTAPAITSADHATFVSGSAGSFTVTPTGSPSPTLSEAGALPSGVNFDPSTGILNGVPAPGVSGAFPLQFTASNSLGDAVQNFTLNVSLGQTAKPTFSLASGTYTAAQAVTISDATLGAAIYYTTDGTPASAASTPYSVPVAISSTTVLNAIAVTPGYSDSAAATATYTLRVPTPTFNPAAGSYGGAQSVMISDALPGVSIFYTTNGTTPTASSTPFTDTVSIPATTTLRAIARLAGWSDSAVGTAAYTIQATPAPTFSPGTGTYSTPQNIMISDAAGVPIYYTTDGTPPDTTSNLYVNPVPVTQTTVLQAIASAGGASSATGTATYTLRPAAPVLSLATGTYNSAQSVTISDATAGASIFYSTDGSTPTAASTPFGGAIPISSTTTLRTVAVVPGWTNSNTTTATYTLQASSPTFSPAAGTFTVPPSVSIFESTPGAAIFYTTNGSTPTTSSTPYLNPVPITTTTTLNAIAVVPGWSNSLTGSARYTLQTPASPGFTPSPGTYTTTQSVRLTESTSGASIYYTTNGSAPTTASTLYSGPIPVTQTTTIRAIASAGGPNSASVSGTYTLRVATPAVSLAGGTYTSAQSVQISDSTPGAAIYYTTDGSTPTTSSTPYAVAIPVTKTTNLRAIAVLSGWSNSNGQSVTYTLRVPTPTFSPGGGTYTGARTVTILDSLAGVQIYYTTNGSTPTTSSTRYTVAISVPSTRTVRAIAVTSGWSNSSIAVASYTIR